MNNLYDIIGVDKSATRQEIKAAYKKKAQSTHPDKNNGDTEEFAMLQTAYDILSHNESRVRYDETGSINKGPSEAEQRLIALFSIIINGNSFEGDIIDTARGHVACAIKDLSNDIPVVERRRNAFTKHLNRISCSEETNFFETTLLNQIREMDEKVTNLNKELELMDEVADMLCNYSDGFN